jgi:hypothetical protein
MSSLTKQDFLGFIEVMRQLVPLDLPLCKLYGETIRRRELEDCTSEQTFRRSVNLEDGTVSDIAMDSLKGMSYDDQSSEHQPSIQVRYFSGWKQDSIPCILWIV